MSDNLKQKTVSGVVWSSIERFSVQGVQFILQIFMARLLLPSDYGVIGMLAIFLAVSQSIIDSGFSNALIRKVDRTETDCSTVFYFNIAVGAVLYALLFFTAPSIAQFYRTPILTKVLRIVALNLLFNSCSVVQRAKLTINVDFKTQARASFTAVIISGSVGLVMAYMGFGVWSLAVQSVLNTGINFVLLWFFVRWRPLRVFSIASFRELFSYGSKLLLSGLLNTAYQNIYTLVIGKTFHANDLGYFTRADQFAKFPSANVTGILQRVTFPILSKIQEDVERLADIYRKYLRLSAFLIFPLMTGLAALARPFVLLLLTEKWLGVVGLLQLLCFAHMWYPIHAINLNLLQVKGRSDLFLKLEVFKKIVGISILCITIPMGLTAMCTGKIVSSFLALIINTYYTGRLISMGFIRQMVDLLPIFVNSIIMFAVITAVSRLFSSNVIVLITGTITGVVCYIFMGFITKSEEMKSFFSLLPGRKAR